MRQVLCPVLLGRDEEIRYLQAAPAAAEATFLSPRTVEKHVASLLAKTGLRRGAASWVFRRLDG